jgi:dihydrofolate reductase
MGKLIVTVSVSLDGYSEGPGGNVMAMQMDSAFDSYCAERLRSADALVLGRSTFQMFSGFWPAVAENPDASPAQREISRRDNEVQKLVVSDTLSPDDLGAWLNTTRIVPRAEAQEVISEWKRRTIGDLLVFGSRIMWNELLAAGLVDEIHLILGSRVVGDGTPAFGSGVLPDLRLLGVRTFEESTNVLLRYAVTSGAEAS